MSGAPRRLFSYRDDPGRMFLAVTVVGGVIALFLLACLIETSSSSSGGLAIGLVVSLFVVALGQAGFFWYRPIAVSDEGVAAMIGDRVWRRIAWRDMDRIEKRVVPVESDGEGGFIPSFETIRFRSGRRTIPVKSSLVEFEALKRCVTKHAKRRGIEIVSVEPQPLWQAAQVTRLDQL